MSELGERFAREELDLDNMGRMRLPQLWLEAVGRDRHVFVMPDPAEKCLRLVSVRNMEDRIAKIRERAIIDPAMNRALKVIGENTEQVDVDNEGYIGISEKLLVFAGITRRVTMVDGEWYTQLWNPEELNRKDAQGKVDELCK